MANKIDLPEARLIYEEFASKLSPDIKVFPISAFTGAGLEELLNEIITKLDVLPLESGYKPTLNNYEPFKEKYSLSIIREKNILIVENNDLLRRVARFDLNNDDSLRSLQKLLKNWGVFKALSEAGVKEGDSVRIGDFEFIYFNEE